MIRDICDNEVEVGDLIALACRVGDSAELCTYKILSIEEKDRWSHPQIAVKAQKIKSRWKNTTSRASILHGETFYRKALIIEKAK